MGGLTDHYSFTYIEAGDQWGSSLVPASAPAVDTAIYAREQDTKQLASDLYILPVLTHDAAARFPQPVEYVMAQHWLDMAENNWVANGLTTASSSASTVLNAAGRAYNEGHLLYFGSASSLSTYLPTPSIGATSASPAVRSMPGFTWNYRLTALTSVGESLPSNTVQVVTSASTSSVTLFWPVIPNATSYTLYRTKSNLVATVVELVTGLTSASYLDTTAVASSSTVVPTDNTAGVPNALFYLRADGTWAEPERYWSTASSTDGQPLAEVTTDASGDIDTITDTRVTTPSLSVSGGFTFPLGEDLIFFPDNTYNIGEVAAHRPAHGYFGTSVVAPLFTGALNGIASSASVLNPGRTINGVLFNGSANITVTAAAGTLTGTTTASNVVNSSIQNFGLLNAHVLFSPDNTYDIGAPGATRPRRGYFGTEVVTPLVTATSFVGDLTGTSASATFAVTAALASVALIAQQLQTPRNINGVAFDGTANITVTAAAGTLTGTTLASSITASSLTSFGILAAHLLFVDNTYDIGAAGATRPRRGYFATELVTPLVTATSIVGALTGNASTATALQTARTINGVSFNGTANITIPTGSSAASDLTGTTMASNVVTSSLTRLGDTVGIGGAPSAVRALFINSTINAASGVAYGIYNSPYLQDTANSDTLTGALLQAVVDFSSVRTGMTLYNVKIGGSNIAAGFTNSYGLYVEAYSGGTNNYAAKFDGSVWTTGHLGFGTAPVSYIGLNHANAVSATSASSMYGLYNQPVMTAQANNDIIYGLYSGPSLDANSKTGLVSYGNYLHAGFNSTIGFSKTYGLYVDGFSFATTAIAARFEGRVGIGVDPSHPLSVLHATSTQIQFGTAADAGGFLVSTAATNSFLSAGGAWNGTNWIAKGTTAVIQGLSTGEWQVFINTGLSTSASYSVTQRLGLTSASGVKLNVGDRPGTPTNLYSTYNSQAWPHVEVRSASSTPAGLSLGATSGSSTTGSVGVISFFNASAGTEGTNDLRVGIIAGNLNGAVNTGSYDFYLASAGTLAVAMSLWASGKMSLGGAALSHVGFYMHAATLNASAGGAWGQYIQSALVTSANADELIGLQISPTYTNGASHTSVGAYGIKIPSFSATGLAAGYGIVVSAPTGASVNYSALFFGNVGMGTAAPSNILHVANASGYTMKLDASSSGQPAIQFWDANGTRNKWILGSGAVSATDGFFVLYDERQSIVRFVVDTSGYMGIGTTAPTAGIHVTKNGSSGTAVFGGTTYNTHFMYNADSSEDTYIRGGKTTSKILFDLHQVNIGSAAALVNSLTKLQVTAGRTYFGANSEVYSIGVSYGGGSAGTFYIGGSNAANPSLVFSNNAGTGLAVIFPSSCFAVGSPTGGTGGDLGSGWVNVAGGVGKNGTTYTNPDYALEHYFTGKVERFKDNPGADSYNGLMPLTELETYMRENLRLPRVGEQMDIFDMADIALEKVEELTLHAIELNKRLAVAEAELILMQARLQKAGV